MIAFRIREWLKHEHVEDCLAQLLRNEKMTSDDLRKWQMTHLNNLLSYLVAHNPYYSKYIKERGIDISTDNKTPEEILNNFPIIDKAFIRENFSNWLSNELCYGDVVLRTTSGSTGVPFQFHSSKKADDYKTASKYRLYHRFGVEIDDKQLCFGASFSQGATWLQDVKSQINNRFVNKRYFCDTSHFTDEVINDVINQINNLHIKSLWGYPSAIFEVAKYALDNKKQIKNKHLKAIFYSGEGHNDYMNQVIREVFGENVSIVDEYNSIEGFIGGTFQDGLIHLNDDTAIFEVLKEDGTISSYGKGELLVTTLFNQEFPFIRYKNGDVVDISESTGTIL